MSFIPPLAATVTWAGGFILMANGVMLPGAVMVAAGVLAMAIMWHGLMA